MDNTVDLLQIKIEKAKMELPEETRRAIDSIDWKTEILKMRSEKGYSFTQIEDLEIETELLLCGLLDPEDYPKELEKRLNIPKPQVDVLVNEMNEKIFKKIREELVKNIERKKISEDDKKETEEDEVHFESREKMLEEIENADLSKQKELPTGNIIPPARRVLEGLKDNSENLKTTPSILEQKLAGSFQIPKTETEHSLTNMTKTTETTKKGLPKVDPYREIPE